MKKLQNIELETKLLKIIWQRNKKLYMDETDYNMHRNEIMRQIHKDISKLAKLLLVTRLEFIKKNDKSNLSKLSHANRGK